MRGVKSGNGAKAIISGPCSGGSVGKGNDWLFVSGGFSLVLSFSAKRKNKEDFERAKNERKTS
jgi:hypothetical protein